MHCHLNAKIEEHGIVCGLSSISNHVVYREWVLVNEYSFVVMYTSEYLYLYTKRKEYPAAGLHNVISS